jgi:redox-sensitive bicupin YhaK (pirin superfamily)
METLRKVKKVNRGRPAVDGAGVKLVRVIGYRTPPITIRS